MKLEIEMPADKFALMQGIAGWHGQTVAEWLNERLTDVLQCDLDGAASDLENCKLPPLVKRATVRESSVAKENAVEPSSS